MDKRLIMIISYIVLLVGLLLLTFVYLGPSADANEFDFVPFPQLESVSKTTLVIEKPLNIYIAGSENITENTVFNRDKFSANIIIESNNKKNYSALVSKRGASSFSYVKHQFSVSLQDEDGMQVKKKILDMPKGEDWVLSGPIIDRTMMRNYIGYKTAFEIMPYAPRTQYTELYVQVNDENPEYLGLYQWTEKIRQGGNRVDISPTIMNLDETSFIISKDTYRDGNQLINVYGKELYMYSYQYIDVYPKRTLTQGQMNYIGDIMTEFERNLYHDKYDIPGLGYAELINVDSFVDYYIINEFFQNTDAGLKSTYFYKDVRGPLHIGPVWDFNNSMGSINAVFKLGDYTGLTLHDRPLYERLLQDPVFVDKVLERYEELRRGPLKTDNILASIDQAAVVLRPYVEKDHKTYPQAVVVDNMTKFLKNSDPELLDHLLSLEQPIADFEGEIDRLKSFIINRANWLDQHINSISDWTD
ncbi:hypothetical protein EZV73_03580 [Acidaminobacter sp. JC074]|uniref:CotH kinase family protein n=1 Tax=Acidaminobacter sp. JC074 TaxID=2530199 RepID=UPI001F0CF8D7|nr:CotH kinase family protein [Acidaminobacter sp. JC074]MCH4886631.1 hypothetical protein [Acidaminobacter sp. JC074]